LVRWIHRGYRRKDRSPDKDPGPVVVGGYSYRRGVYNAPLFTNPQEERRSMRIRLALLLASAFVFIAFGTVACGGGEEESQPAPEEEKKEEKKEVKKEEKTLEVKAPEEEKKKEEVKEPKVGGPVQKFEDLPEEVKEKLPEEAKQEIKQGLPEKKAEQ
jgi:hypothetical protein